ncbi:carbohydrate kinase [Agrococcus terreus]|uniref:Carbohydrate kinase n=2 Tax=Agrococcus terreus TaxID=574649 RepID=A0ABQ2KRR0_9MICO|nr:carbohydrate kinase [Agrococcus terreus]
MALVTPVEAEPLRTAERFAIHIGGAESTVALYLADAGRRAAWVSRLGDDPLGRRVLDELVVHGVDVAGVELDAAAPTGVYFKDPGDDATVVHYYRGGSAASRMDVREIARMRLPEAAVVHLSGITAAISASCRALLVATMAEARAHGALVSFDVNHRPGLWSAAEAAPVLADLARRADLVFVGRDEAEALWGEGDPERLGALLAPRGALVVKDGGLGATEVHAGESAFVPAQRVEVVEVVGAGDAFTAGYLGALLDGADAEARLAAGHAVAARALASTFDFAPSQPAPDAVGS